jgi:hypothetical protein
MNAPACYRADDQRGGASGSMGATTALDLGYAFTIYFVTLGPLKTIPAFFMATRGADRRTVVAPGPCSGCFWWR